MALASYVEFTTRRGRVLRCSHCGAELEERGLTAANVRNWTLDHDDVCPQRRLPLEGKEGG